MAVEADVLSAPNAAEASPVRIVNILACSTQVADIQITCPDADRSVMEQIAHPSVVTVSGFEFARRVENAARQRDLRGLVIVQSHTGRPFKQVPKPLMVPIEPIELEESQAVLSSLVETVMPAEARRVDRSVVPARRFKRWLIRIGLPLGILINVIVQTITRVIEDVSQGTFRLSRSGLCLAIMAITLGMFALSAWWNSAQWFLVPGGVVVRRKVWGRIGVQVERFTPADSYLLCFPDQWAFTASVKKGARTVTRRVTPLELVALLAAWQSPIPAPAAEKLVDLQ